MSTHPNNPSRVWQHWKHKERFRLNALLSIPVSRRSHTENQKIRQLERKLGVGLIQNPEGVNQWNR